MTIRNLLALVVVSVLAFVGLTLIDSALRAQAPAAVQKVVDAAVCRDNRDSKQVRIRVRQRRNVIGVPALVESSELHVGGIDRLLDVAAVHRGHLARHSTGRVSYQGPGELLMVPDRTAPRTSSMVVRPPGAVPPHSNVVTRGVQWNSATRHVRALPPRS